MVSTGCTSGLDAVGHAARADPRGQRRHDGRRRAPTRRSRPITVACFDAIKATTPRNDDPEHASRPFDRTRNGFVLGEGAAVFVLEELEHARRRGAHIYAEVAGFASRRNAFHMTGLRPDGREMAEAIRRGAGRGPARRAQPSTTSTRTAPAPSRTTGTRPPRSSAASASTPTAAPVSSIKSMVGHSLGAIGSIEIAACALAIEHGVVPPTANLHEPDPSATSTTCRSTARERPVGHRADASAAASAASRAPWCSPGPTGRHDRRARGRWSPASASPPPTASAPRPTGPRPCAGRAASRRSRASTRRLPGPGWPARCRGFDAGAAPAGPAAAADRPHDPAGAGGRRRGAGRRGRGPGAAARVRRWASSPRAPPAASSSASASWRSCGARAAAVRQRLPVLRLVLRGEHRPDLDQARPARSQRRAGQRARRAVWTRVGAGPAAAAHGQPADRDRRRRRRRCARGAGRRSSPAGG